jgi:tetratricopeptide (TPR) repeat protein
LFDGPEVTRERGEREEIGEMGGMIHDRRSKEGQVREGWPVDPAPRKALLGDPLRLVLFIVVFGTKFIAPKAVMAQQPVAKPMVGRRVVQRMNEFTLHIENRVIDRKRVIHFYRVEQTNGPWLWVRAEGNGFSGWALADQVVAVEDAIAFFTDQIRDDPENVFPYVMRAMLWQDQKQIDKALRDYDQVLRLDPNRGWIYNDRGILHFEQKDYEKALADFDQAIRLEPTNANFYNNRGTLRRARKVYDLAVADFSEAIRLYPEYIYAYYNRGLTQADRKEYDLAIADFNEVIRFDPHDAVAYYNRGLAWSAKEQFDGAIRDFDRAIELDKKLSFVYRDRGTARAARKEYDQAIADYDQALRLSPKSARTYYQRGLARVEIKQFDKALADYDAAIGLDPGFDEAYLSRAWLLASCPNTRLRDPNKAVESATKACELTNWQEPHDLGGLAAVYAETGNVAAALKWHSKALELLTAEGKSGTGEIFLLGHH